MARAGRGSKCVVCKGAGLYAATEEAITNLQLDAAALAVSQPMLCYEHRPPLRTDVPVSRFADEAWPAEAP